MKFEEYLSGLRGKSVAVIGIGVSNQPLIRLLLDRGIPVTACDKKSREALGPLGDELEPARRAGAGGGGGPGQRTHQRDGGLF